MQGNGLMGRVMGVEFIPVRMGVDMLGNSSGVSSTALVTTISGNFATDFPDFCSIILLLMYFVIAIPILSY